jgi:Flp pilus assembly protein TadD
MPALDKQEMLHMAIHASANGRADDAIRTLKELIDVDADNGDAHFLIAANYAEIAMLDRSIAHYRQAVDLMPEQDYARMQFALILTAADRLDEARELLQPFLADGRDDCYCLFAKGLVALFEEDLPTARELFEAGRQANTINEPLNDDIGRVVAELDAAGSVPANKPVEDKPGESPAAYLLSNYNKRH